MSRLNMVRKIKDSKNGPIKIPDTFELKREKGWNERFIYNKLEDNIPEKRFVQKKSKNDYTSNIKYLKEQFNGEKAQKSSKNRGKSGYKFYSESKTNINKNKIKINNNNIMKYNNMNRNIFNDINNTGDNDGIDISLLDGKKLRYTNNNFKIINKNNNSADYNKNNNNNNNNLNNINNISKNNNSSFLYNMSLSELEVYLGILWNKLGVKDSFQKTFNKLKEDMENDEAKKEFTLMEIENLEKLEKFLQKLCKEIENREKAVLLLKKLIEVMEKQFIELNLDIRDNILNDFYQTITGYRINTIKVVESISTYNQLFSHSINKGKFIEEYLLRKYKLVDNDNSNNNGNYLLKIKNDLNFLGDSKINGYKNLNLYFNSNSDPFLLNISEQVPINIEYYLRIKQCQYIIMQEVIFDSLNTRQEFNYSNISDIKESNKKKKLEPINQNNSKVISSKNSNKNLESNNHKIIIKDKENISCVDKKQNIKNNNINNDKKFKENIKIKKSEKIVIDTPQLIDKNNYENFFGTKNLKDDFSEDQTLEELNKQFNNIQNLTNNKKENNKIKIEKKENIENKDNNETKNEENIKKTEKKDNNELTDNKDNNEKNKYYEFNNNNINENKEDSNIKEEIENKDNNEIEEYKEEIKIKKKNEIKNENIKKEINNDNHNEEINNKINEYKDNNEDLVNIEQNININEEQDKDKDKNKNKDKDNNIDRDNNIGLNKDNNVEEDILENSLVISKKIKSQEEKSRPVTPKSLRGSKIISLNEITQNKDNNISNKKNEINIHPIKDNDYIAFYCGKISNFISIYSSYYESIPEEQKLIFNLKSDPLEYLYNNFYPKIIIYSDKKTKIIKGLCIFSYIFTNDAKNNGLYIEHISSYNEESREKIFEQLLLFIKENSYNIFGFENKKDKDIYIDLYYKNENGKFQINTEIRDYFRNKLKFKWVKLENLSKFVRFQKMRHQFLINGNNNNIDLLNNEYDDNNILNQSILGRKEFNNDENRNDSDEEQESEDDDEINVDISTIFDLDNKNNENKNINKNQINDFHIEKNINLLNNFSIKNKTILKFNKKIYKNKINKITTYIKYSNPFNFIYLLNKINEENNSLNNNISPNISSYFNQKDSTIISQILSNCSMSKKNILLESHYYYSDTQELMKNKNKFKINSNIDILPLFDKCISFKYNNYYYNRIQQKKIETFMERETKQIFYMINKADNHIILISSSLNDNFKQKYIYKENKNNIGINFMNIYNNLFDINNNDKNILYIPAFEIKCKFVNNCFNNINKDKSNLFCFEDYYNVKYLTEELIIRKNSKNKKIKDNSGNLSMSFDYDLINENDINNDNFINDNFLLVILHLNIIDDLRALPLLTLYITKDNFISDKNM